ncbi:hypothetical protein NBRC116591_07560 [Sessilibacter corallicola]|uniref:Uncharacterized protein n=1 Tax=Sessilibacter corallicola TaxID=2904075 RepID=A0ABQ0A5N6_9GAMM
MHRSDCGINRLSGLVVKTPLDVPITQIKILGFLTVRFNSSGAFIPQHSGNFGVLLATDGFIIWRIR